MTDMIKVTKRRRDPIDPAPGSKRFKSLDAAVTPTLTYFSPTVIFDSGKPKTYSPGPSSTLAQLNLKPHTNPLLTQYSTSMAVTEPPSLELWVTDLRVQ